jgi:hypothetical protein
MSSGSNTMQSRRIYSFTFWRKRRKKLHYLMKAASKVFKINFPVFTKCLHYASSNTKNEERGRERKQSRRREKKSLTKDIRHNEKFVSLFFFFFYTDCGVGIILNFRVFAKLLRKFLFVWTFSSFYFWLLLFFGLVFRTLGPLSTIFFILYRH